MAAPSRPPNNAQYGVDGRCHTCGRKIPATSSAWFQGYPVRAIYCDHLCYAGRPETSSTHPRP